MGVRGGYAMRACGRIYVSMCMKDHDGERVSMVFEHDRATVTIRV